MKRQFLQSFVSDQAQTPQQASQSDNGSTQSEFAQIVALPRELVTMLDQSAKGENISDLAATFCGEMAEMLRSRSQYLLHEAESKALSRAQQKLEELDTSLRSNNIDEATENALTLFRELHWFEQMREKNRQNPLNGINELLIWGLSSLHGQANPNLLTPLLALAAADVDAMLELYKTAEEHLPAEVQAVFLLGVERVTHGFSTLQQAQAVGRDALQSIADGAGLLAQLKKWRDETEAENSGSVPLAGERVQRMLRQIERSGQIKERTLELWQEKDYPALLQFWLDTRRGLIVTSRHRRRLIHEIEEALEQLQTLAELGPAHQRTLLIRLEELFSGLSAYRLDLSPLNRSSRRWKADLILAALAGGIPTFYLANTEQNLREQQQEELALALEAFRLEDDSDQLIALLESELL